MRGARPEWKPERASRISLVTLDDIVTAIEKDREVGERALVRAANLALDGKRTVAPRGPRSTGEDETGHRREREDPTDAG